jgi:N-acetylglucosamine kinase-like BadF-type ATPase
MPKNRGKTVRRHISHNIYLGVDGGGTKTHIVLVNEAQEIISEGFAGASNPLRVGIENAVGNIFTAIDNACDAANRSRSDIVSATLGLAGVRRADIRQSVLDSFRKRLPLKKIQVFTDAEIALYGTTLGKSGLVIIAGTGSICIGRDESGNVAMAGGWGPIAGDEGGGAGIAKRGLQAIAKALDGRGKPTAISQAGLDYFRTSTPENMLIAIYSPQVDNARIAGFARFVVEAAKENDEIAIEIMNEAGFELGSAAVAVIKKLKLERKKFPIGYVGSIFKADEILTDSLLETVHKIAPKAYLTAPKLIPAHAAAQMSFEKRKNGANKPIK